jgi:hypothetical protein
MKTLLTIVLAALILTPHTTPAAERSKSQAQIETAQSALNDFKARAGVDAKLVSTDLENAAGYLAKAAAALKAGEKMFGGLADEAEQDVNHETAMLDVTLKLAATKLERTKIGAELNVLGKKVDAVKAKLKVFDDFRAEIARLKGELATNEKTVKELETLKAEKGALEAQIVKLSTEKRQLDALKEENLRLSRKLEKFEAGQQSIQVQPLPKAATPAAEAIVIPAKVVEPTRADQGVAAQTEEIPPPPAHEVAPPAEAAEPPVTERIPDVVADPEKVSGVEPPKPEEAPAPLDAAPSAEK